MVVLPLTHAPTVTTATCVRLMDIDDILKNRNRLAGISVVAKVHEHVLRK